MKILILTSRFGMGHYCAAEAIKEELQVSDSDDIIEIQDIVKVLFPSIYKLVYAFFNLFICRFSGIYNFINSFATKHEKTCLNRRILNKINCLIKKYDPDLIISTWSAASRYVSIYKKKYENDILLYTYITDITAHDGWITDASDMYFVATKSTKESLIARGIDDGKIIINGIPVRQSFKQDLQFKDFHHENVLTFQSMDNNHEFLGEFHKNKKEILIMGGGLGLIPNIDNILKSLYEVNNIHITIITGKNKKILKNIKRNYPKINAIGYTNKVDIYMKRADLIITKPGGISIFEAIYTTTPLYVMKPCLSQEIGNAEFIEKMFIGKIVWENNFYIAEDIIALINNEKLMEKMKCNMKSLQNEILQLNLKKIYERNIQKYVDFNTADNYYIGLSDIWRYSHITLQKVE